MPMIRLISLVVLTVILAFAGFHFAGFIGDLIGLSISSWIGAGIGTVIGLGLIVLGGRV